MESWATLFERGARADTSLAGIAAALDEIREDHQP